CCRPPPAKLLRPLADRLCMLIYWLSNTPRPANSLSSARNCRSISPVYEMISRSEGTRGRTRTQTKTTAWCDVTRPSRRLDRGDPFFAPLAVVCCTCDRFFAVQNDVCAVGWRSDGKLSPPERGLEPGGR